MSKTSVVPKVPQHIGIIPDGNRRWAKAQGLPSLEGHRRGVEAIKTVAEAALDSGVSYITFYAFSTENWRRASIEVKYLMDLFYRVATQDIDDLHKRGIQFRIIGSRAGLSAKLSKAFDDAILKTAENTRGVMSLCLNYGGEQELVEAMSGIIREGTLAEDVTPELITAHLYEPDIPAVDLIIRTSNEHRISGFMLWRASYAEFIFVDKQWPEFGPGDLSRALLEYSTRQRRFGA
jgi:undecaprenyl diphosphate synthase